MKPRLIEIQAIREIRSECDAEECEDCELSGTVTILGVYHHVTFVRVRKVHNGQYEGQGPVGAAYWYDALTRMDPGGNFQTVRIPGFKGRHVCIVTPFQQ